MTPDNQREPIAPEASPQDLRATEEKRVAARRRFLRVGAGGSAALVMTVTHKRSFAGGVKKGVVASHCTSLQGVPDLKGVKNKKALEFSAMGTPKHLICRRPGDGQPQGNCAEIYPSRYANINGDTYLVADGNELNKGCGNLNDTVAKSQNYRLYGQDNVGGKAPGYGEGSGGGFCPIAFDNSGNLNYVQADYFVKKVVNNVLTTVKVGACTPAPLP